MIFLSLSPDLRDIKGMKLECMSCQIDTIPSEALTSLTMQPFYNHRSDTLHSQGNKRQKRPGCNSIMKTRDLLFQEVLLGSYNGAWPTYSDPSNYFSVCKPVVFHDITGYQRPCSSKTSCKRGKQNKKNKI